jgi:2-aminoadipate transaminase
MDFSTHFARRVAGMKPSALREILKLTQTSKVVSFAGGLPAPNLFPKERIAQAAQKVLNEQPSAALQYGTSEGYTPLREWVAQGMKVSTGQVQIVSGSQQGLDIIAKIFLDAGDKVVVAEPTYLGALRTFDVYEAQYLSVLCDDEGMLPEALEAALKQNPKLIYAIPNFDNPTGISMSLERRQHLVTLARKYGVPIYEDNPYGELRFEGVELPNLYELAPDLVIYGGTFSKIMVPGFRLGWIVAQSEVIDACVRAKQAADLHTATFTQMIAHEVTKDNFMDQQILKVRAYYQQQRNLMISAIEKNFPEDAHFTRPSGGMFLWVTLPKGNDTLKLLEQAVKRGVAYVPGEPFYANGGGLNTLRLSYSVATAEQVEKGIASLGELLREDKILS